MRNRFVLIGTAVVLGTVLGGVARAWRPVRIPIALPSPPTERPVGPAGGRPLVSLELEPAALLKDGSGESLEYALSVVLRPNANGDVSVRHSLEIMDDSGNALQRPVISDVAAVRGEGFSRELKTPKGLRNGYFLVRAQVAAADGVDDTLQIAERYFSAKDGTVVPVSAQEYFERSNAALARPVSSKPAVAQ